MSRLEDQLATQIRAAGLPEPEREARVVPGRRYRADFAWPAHRLVVEVEGGIFRRGRKGPDPGHASPGGILRDIEKASAYATHGYRLVRVAAPHIRDGRALGWIEAALAGETDPGPGIA